MRAAALVLALVVVAPAWAWACPSCATRDGPGLGVLALVGAMIAVPYAVAAAAFKVIRRIQAASAEEPKA